MKVEVRFQLFAALKDAAGASHVDVAVPVGTTIDDAMERVLAGNTELQRWRGRIAFAREDRLLNGGFVIDQPMRIDLLPPVSGG